MGCVTHFQRFYRDQRRKVTAQLATTTGEARADRTKNKSLNAYSPNI
jgi:hypothetical protein